MLNYQTIHLAGLRARRRQVRDDAHLRRPHAVIERADRPVAALLKVEEYVGLLASPGCGGEPVHADGPGGGP